MGAEAPTPDMNMSSGMPLSETDGMPSLSGMSPSDAAAFLQSNRKVGLRGSAGALQACLEGSISDHNPSSADAGHPCHMAAALILRMESQAECPGKNGTLTQSRPTGVLPPPPVLLQCLPLSAAAEEGRRWPFPLIWGECEVL
jgi:hypothetical protein